MNKALVIGSGGREHALAKALAKSQQIQKVFVAPGNAGMVLDKSVAIECVPIQVDQMEALADFASQQNVEFTFVGPEWPLHLGVVDLFRDRQLAIIGPTKAAAQLETSKGFAKDLMTRAGVSTANYQRFTHGQTPTAKQYLQQCNPPYVIKKDGLAAGKGVMIADTLAQAEQAVHTILDEPNNAIVIEEFLHGEEFSFFALVNGEHILPVGDARDYKRIGDGNKGLNTGGMGAFSPVPFVDDALHTQVLQTIIEPIAKQMVVENIAYTGVIYAGLMLTQEGLKVIEFNARFGDPETQILLPRLATDFYALCKAHLAQNDLRVEYHHQVSHGVVVAARGYPQAYPTGMPIDIDHTLSLCDVSFSGVTIEKGQLLANGGRILMVTSLADTLKQAKESTYQKLMAIRGDALYYRQDIGQSFIDSQKR